MHPRLQDMLDHHDIRQLLALYCHACDRGDAALMASVYVPEGSFDDHGSVKAEGHEYARIMTEAMMTRTTGASHILGQSLIVIDGDRAGAETAFVAFFRLPESDKEPERINQLMGRFVDQLARIDGAWKIRHRTCLRDTSLTSPVTRDDYAQFGFVEARRDADDLGAALIGLAHRG